MAGAENRRWYRRKLLNIQRFIWFNLKLFPLFPRCRPAEVTSCDRRGAIEKAYESTTHATTGKKCCRCTKTEKL